MIKFFSKAIAFIFVFNSFAAGVKAEIRRAKIVITSGDVRSGKTSLAKMLTGCNYQSYHKTLNFEGREIEFELGNNKIVWAMLYDSPGYFYYDFDESFQKAICEGCENAHLVIMVINARSQYQNGHEDCFSRIAKINPDCKFIFVITQMGICLNKTKDFIKNKLIGEEFKERTEAICYAPELYDIIRNYFMNNYDKLPKTPENLYSRIFEKETEITIKEKKKVFYINHY